MPILVDLPWVNNYVAPRFWQVYSPATRVSFSWRHWGHFTGSHEGAMVRTCSEQFSDALRSYTDTHTHTYIYIYIETDSKLKNRHNDRWSKVERTCEALLMWWCCLMLPVSSRKGWRWAAHWNLGLWRRSREQQVATHWCGYLLEARTFHPGRNSWEAASGCLRLPRKHIRHHAPKICLKCSLSGIPLWAGNPSGWTLFHPCTQKRSCGALIAVHRRRA